MSSLAPGLLVATPKLQSPDFVGSVVLMVEHSPEGALGFVVNRLCDTKLRSVFEQLEMPLEEMLSPVPVMHGGPVASQTGWVVFESALSIGSRDDVLQVTDHLAVSASKDVLLDAARGLFDGRAMLVQGYAGWGAGQLESEMAAGAWLPVDLDAGILFETPLDRRWAATLKLLGVHPASIAHQSIAQA
jgi:putative transcriptional regulator